MWKCGIMACSLDRDGSKLTISTELWQSFRYRANYFPIKQQFQWSRKRKSGMAKYRLQSWQNHNYKLIWNQDALLNTSLFQENAKARYPIPPRSYGSTESSTASVFIAGNLMVFARCYPLFGYLGLIIPALSLSKQRTVPRGRCKDAITQKISQRAIWTGTWAPARSWIV